MTSILAQQGMTFDLLTLEKYHFDDWEIAWQLSGEYRYVNAPLYEYSVAQHCVLAQQHVTSLGLYGTKLANLKLRLATLLHDASEAFLRDIPGPFKVLLPDYKKLEREVQTAIYKWYGVLEYLDAPEIKTIDKELLNAERAVFFPAEYEYRGPIKVEPWVRRYAADRYCDTLHDLYDGINYAG